MEANKDQLTKEIIRKLKEMGAKDEQIPHKTIETNLKMLLNPEYGVPSDQVVGTCVNQAARDLNLVRRGGGNDKVVEVKDITAKAQWVSIKCKVVSLFENNKPPVRQSGIVGDPSGTIKFTVFERNADLPGLPLIEGKCYVLRSVVSDEFRERFSIKLNKNTVIEPLKEDIEVKENLVEVSGLVVDIQQGSGLIRRCNVCKRAMVKGVCSEHGRQDGESDLRVKAVLDDGRTAQNLVLNEEATAKVTGIDLAAARKIWMDSEEATAVEYELRKKLVGKYYTATGPLVGKNLLVKAMVPTTGQPDIAGAIAKLEAV